MSVNYVNKSTGDLIRVAGQGKAEYGTSIKNQDQGMGAVGSYTGQLIYICQ